MPFLFIAIGIVLFITALNGTFKAFGSQLYSDLFTGSPSFIAWALAIVMVGLIGYIPGAKKPADAFIVLIVLGMVLETKGGVFSKLQDAIKSGPIAPAASASVAPATAGSALASSSSPAASTVKSVASSTAVTDVLVSALKTLAGLL